MDKTISIVSSVQTMLNEAKAIEFDNYTHIQPSLMLTMNRFVLSLASLFSNIDSNIHLDLIIMFVVFSKKCVQHI